MTRNDIKANWTSRRGFTLVELLVVIAIIGVLVALLLPAVQAAREAARRTDCRNRMRQLGIAVQNYHDVKRELPPSRIGDWYATWLYLVLPYIEQSNVSNLWDEKNGYVASAPPEFREFSIPTFICPSQGHEQLVVLDSENVSGSLADYQVFTASTLPQVVTRASNPGSGNPTPASIIASSDGWDNATMHGCDGAIIQPHRYEDLRLIMPETPTASIRSWKSRTALRHITDGTSNTYMIGEVARWVTEREDPNTGEIRGNHTFDGNDNRGQICGLNARFATDNERSPGERDLTFWAANEWECGIGSAHNGIVNVVMVDASVQSVSIDIDPEVVDGMITREGGEIAGTAPSNRIQVGGGGPTPP